MTEYRFKFRRDVAADWTSINPVLLSGEPGLETDTNKLKFGDGVQNWNDLDYFPNVDDLVAGVASVDGREGVVTLDDLYADIVHTHAQSSVTNLVSDLATLTTNVAGKAATVHTHAQSDVTNLVSDLSGKAATSHTHAQSDVTNLVSDLSGKAATSHTHAAGDTTSGTFAIGRIPTGTSGTTVSLGNHTHPVSPAMVVLTDASTIAVNATLGEHFRVVLTGDHILGNPTGAVDGQMLLFELVQDGSGGQAVTLDTKYNDPNGYFTGQSTAAGKRDKLGVQYNSTADKFDVLAFAAGY